MPMIGLYLKEGGEEFVLQATDEKYSSLLSSVFHMLEVLINVIPEDRHRSYVERLHKIMLDVKKEAQEEVLKEACRGR